MILFRKGKIAALGKIVAIIAVLLMPAGAFAATNFLWGNIGTVTTLLSGSALNALANNAGTPYGPEINNVNGPLHGTLWLHLDTNSIAFTSGSCVSVYLVSSTTPNTASGTYPTYTSGTTPAYSGNGYVGCININPKTQSSNVVDEIYQGVTIPAGFFKTIMISSAGQPLPATANNTLSLYTTPTQY
jgi:hypothetical protein